MTTDIKEYIIADRGQSPFTDVQLPFKQGAYFPTRSLDDICAASIHHQAGTGSIVGVAMYHSSPDCHICKNGCPGFCYHFAIDRDGGIYQTNDLKSIVWSSGKKKSYALPSEASCFDTHGKQFNKYSISIMLRGDFDGPGHKGTQDPTPEQLASLKEWVGWAVSAKTFQGRMPIPFNNMLGHCHVNKKACPGFIIQEWIEEDVWSGNVFSEPVNPWGTLGEADIEATKAYLFQLLAGTSTPKGNNWLGVEAAEPNLFTNAVGLGAAVGGRLGDMQNLTPEAFAKMLANYRCLAT